MTDQAVHEAILNYFSEEEKQWLLRYRELRLKYKKTSKNTLRWHLILTIGNIIGLLLMTYIGSLFGTWNPVLWLLGCAAVTYWYFAPLSNWVTAALTRSKDEFMSHAAKPPPSWKTNERLLRWLEYENRS